jgi:hypothetical protein
VKLLFDSCMSAAVAEFYAAQLAAGAIITVEARRTRVRFRHSDSELDA